MAFAAWMGFVSPLRRQPTIGTCPTGGHRLWWIVQAEDAAAALALLPPYVAARAEAVAVREIEIP